MKVILFGATGMVGQGVLRECFIDAGVAEVLSVGRSPTGAQHGKLCEILHDDFTEDLKKITVPVLVMHGDDDQIVPYADSALLSARLLKNGILKTYKGFPHGMPTTEAATINADLLAFIRA